MEEIVINKDKLLQLIEETDSYANLSSRIQHLVFNSTPITDLQRQAFEAGRQRTPSLYNKPYWEYPSFDDYQNREK